MSMIKEFTKGLWQENPVLVLLLGLCPTLAVTTGIRNGMGMGLATLFVLLGSNVVVSLIRNIVPKKVRIPCYIVIIATFVTLVDMLTAAYFRQLHLALGIFIPLIVVNCTVLGRAEAFASRHTLMRSVMDALGMGVGFTLTLMALGGVREFLSGGALFDVQLIPNWKYEFMLMTFPPGAFIALGFFLAGMNWISARKAAKDGKYKAPAEMDCAHCRLCFFGDRDDEA
ncbi:MAG: electron transport complex subunit E [Candidatus Pacebacteria bacterium]|nr:electron transport complex subunit E [Candidatus Paceibacterota bacterium]